MTPVMVTKLTAPRISKEIIDRPRLIKLLSGHQEDKLILITAPAGYGKTVSALQYVTSLNKPFIWCQLDRYDNDPAVFIQLLITGIRQHFPSFGAETLQLVLQSNPATSLRFIVVSFVNELARLPRQGLMLVLDDYHVIFDPAVHQFVLELLDHLPGGIHLVITTRTSPPFDLSRYVVRGEMGRIDSDALRFTPEEFNELIAHKQISLSQETADSLLSRTHGWAAALKLLTLSASGREALEPSKETEYAYDFLANEVFGQQPDDVRQFLISAAVLETLTPVICDRLTDRNDSEELLADLERQQLFLIPLAGHDKSFRFHQLFREFLLEQLGPDKNRLYCKAAAIAQENGEWDQAVEFYVAAESSGDAVDLIKRIGRDTFRRGRWQTVDRWLGLLDQGAIQTDEWLSLFQAKISVYRGRLGEAEEWVDKSLDAFSKRQDETGIAECLFIRAKIANRNGRYQDSLDLLAKAYPVLQKSDPSLRFELPLEKALIYIRMGRLRQAEDVLQNGLQVVEKEGDSWITAHFLEGLGNTSYMLGETHKALEYYEHAARLCPNGILPGYCADFTGFLYQELGQMDRAFEYLHQSIARKEELGMNDALLPAYFQLSGLYADVGRLEEAEAVYRKAADLIAAIEGERFFLILLKVNLARIRSQQGQQAEAQIILEQILAESQSESGVALIMCRVFYSAVFLMSGNLNEAEKVLIAVLKSGLEFAQALTQCYFLMASVKFLQGDMLNTAKYSRKLLEFSAKKNFEQMFVYMFDHLQPVLQFGLAYQVEVPFIQRVLILLEERGLNLLTELAAHKSASVRARIVFPLSQIRSEAAAGLLQTLARDPDPKIRRLVSECVTDEPVVTKNGILPSPVSIIKQYFLGAAPAKELFNPNDSTEYPEAAHRLQIGMLGPARIVCGRVDIANIRWRFTKSRDLLLYLAHQDKPVGINQILEDLWPEIPLEKGMNLFYNALHWLRQVLQKESSSEADMVIYKTKTCHLHPEVFTTDRQRFMALIQENAVPVNNSPIGPLLLEEAVSLYRGDYLYPLDYPWVMAEREHLKRLHLETAIILGKHYLTQRDYLKAVRLLSPLSEQNPLREELSGILMANYAGLGDKAAVIRQYELLKSHLNEELGLEPDPEMIKLYYRLCSAGDSVS